MHHSSRSRGGHGGLVIQTWGKFFLIFPRRARIEEVLESDLNIGMILPDPVENLSRFIEGHDDEQMLGLRFGTAAHGEG